MHSEPLVSIKMITYGHEKYIAKAIEGIVNQQTDFPFELVIGTDCSPDKTDEIVAEYAAKYPDVIHVVSSDANVGCVINGKRTENACRGKYIAVCEGDDCWDDLTKLQQQVDILENNPDIGLVHCDANGLDTKTGNLIKGLNRTSNLNKDDSEQELVKNLLIGKYVVRTCTACCRHDLMKKIVADNPALLDTKYMMGDIQRWVLLSQVCKFHYIDKPMATYHILTESASRSNDVSKNVRFIENAEEMSLAIVKELNLSEETRKDVLVYFAGHLLSFAGKGQDLLLLQKQWDKLKAANCRIPFFHYIYYIDATKPIFRPLTRGVLFVRKVVNKALRLVRHMK